MQGFKNANRKHCFFCCILLIFSLPSISGAQVSNISRPVGTVDGDANLYTIHSNFAKNGNCFDLQQGWLVGEGYSEAMPFTPKADAKVTHVAMGLLHCPGCGPNEATISLNSDNDNSPGAAIHTWKTNNVEGQAWPSCMYKMTVVKSKKGIALNKGQQYWVVAEAPGSTTLSWAYTYKQLRGDFAYSVNGGRWQQESDYLSSFGVFGIR